MFIRYSIFVSRNTTHHSIPFHFPHTLDTYSRHRAHIHSFSISRPPKGHVACPYISRGKHINAVVFSEDPCAGAHLIYVYVKVNVFLNIRISFIAFLMLIFASSNGREMCVGCRPLYYRPSTPHEHHTSTHRLHTGLTPNNEVQRSHCCHRLCVCVPLLQCSFEMGFFFALCRKLHYGFPFNARKFDFTPFDKSILMCRETVECHLNAFHGMALPAKRSNRPKQQRRKYKKKIMKHSPFNRIHSRVATAKKRNADIRFIYWFRLKMRETHYQGWRKFNYFA